MERHSGKTNIAEHHAPADVEAPSPSSVEHGAPEIVGFTNDIPEGAVTTVEELEKSKQGWLAYFQTRDFYIVLVLGYDRLFSCIESGSHLMGSHLVRS